MGQSLLPVLLLTTVALLSNKVLPILSDKNIDTDTFNTYDQNYDNIFNNRYNTNNIPKNIFYKSSETGQETYIPSLKEVMETMYASADNNRDEQNVNEKSSKKNSYDDEGYKKDQWHNYPRQLDRLHNYQYERDKSETIPDGDDSDNIKHNFNEVKTNEFRIDDSDAQRNVYDSIMAATNPFLILKIQLTYLRDDIKNKALNKNTNLLSSLSDNFERKEFHRSHAKAIDSTFDVVKVKREKPIRTEENLIPGDEISAFTTGNSLDKKMTVRKRLFSLWSRLQSLSHRGHELPHRRHFHAFYGLPDNGNGIVTAETRATFVRPPGSPLRWG